MNLFETIPEQLSREQVDILLQSDNVTVERIVSKGHTAPESGWFDQPRHEWVVVLEGAGQILFEDGQQFTLQRGDTLNIPAHCRHKVIWASPDEITLWLAIHYH